MELDAIETPAVIVEEPVLKRNIETMQKYANERGFLLYPHFKTHKSLKIAEMQIFNGAKGFTVSGLSEAEPLLDHGIRDVIIAYPIVGEKIQKLFGLFKKSDHKISCIVDNVDVARSISEQFTTEHETINVFIKVDVGLHRCGVLPFSDEAKKLARTIVELPGLKLQGLLSHAGHAYSAKSIQQLQGIAEQEIAALNNFADSLQKITGLIEWISVGATPTAKFYESSRYPMIFRPGNYAFFDMIQVSLGVASPEDCAMSVLATVISKPSRDRLIIDAGKKTLTGEKDLSGKLPGFGGILKTLYQKKLNESLVLERLAEEHGIIQVKGRSTLQIGDKIRIIPNHACVVTNLHDYFYMVQGEHVISKVPIEARGKSI